MMIKLCLEDEPPKFGSKMKANKVYFDSTISFSFM